MTLNVNMNINGYSLAAIITLATTIGGYYCYTIHNDTKHNHCTMLAVDRIALESH